MRRMRSLPLLAVLVAVPVAAPVFAAHDACPLKLDLTVGKRGTARIRWQLAEGGKTRDVDMRLPWQVAAKQTDGSMRVIIGPASFPGATKPPAWPKDGVASFALDAYDLDTDWATSVPKDAPADAREVLQQMLSVRYVTSVGIVHFRAAPVAVGGSWSYDEPVLGGVHTHKAYRVVSCGKSRARIAVAEDSTVDGSPARETIRGEVEYALDQPLPVGGWLRVEARRPDGSTVTSSFKLGD